MIRRLVLPILVLAASLSAALAQGLRTPPDLVRSSLVAEPAAVAGAQPFTLAVRMQVKPGWHVYWRNPGDSGLPPEVTWTLPAGFNAGALQWPAPERIPIATLMNYGYEGEVTLLVPVTPPPSLDPANPVQIQAKLTYLVCETECVPGSADLALTLPVGEPRPDPDNAVLFVRARAALPTPALWPLSLSSQGDTLQLDFAASGLKPDTIRNAAYFPYAETAIDNAAAQVMAVDGTGLHLTVARSSPTEAAPTALPGVLTLDEVTESGSRRLAFAYGDEPVLPTATAPPDPVAASPTGAAVARVRSADVCRGRRLRLSRRPHPQPDALRLPRPVDQGVEPRAACGRGSGPPAPARLRLYGRRVGEFPWSGWSAHRPEGRRGGDRLGVPAAIAPGRGRARLFALRDGPEACPAWSRSEDGSRVSAIAWPDGLA